MQLASSGSAGRQARQACWVASLTLELLALRNIHRVGAATIQVTVLPEGCHATVEYVHCAKPALLCVDAAPGSQQCTAPA